MWVAVPLQPGDGADLRPGCRTHNMPVNYPVLIPTYTTEKYDLFQFFIQFSSKHVLLSVAVLKLTSGILFVRMGLWFQWTCYNRLSLYLRFTLECTFQRINCHFG
jgi:hypothetical protein